MVTKNADDHYADAARSRARARAAEKAEYTAFGREIAKRFAPGVKSAPDAIAASLIALEGVTTTKANETEAQMKARQAKELRDIRAEQKRIEQRDDRDEKHLAKWMRKHHYAQFRGFAELRNAALAARREKTRARVEKHRATS